MFNWQMTRLYFRGNWYKAKRSEAFTNGDAYYVSYDGGVAPNRDNWEIDTDPIALAPEGELFDGQIAYVFPEGGQHLKMKTLAIEHVIEALEEPRTHNVGLSDRALAAICDPAFLAELKQAAADARLRRMVEERHRKELSPGEIGGWWVRVLVGFDSFMQAGATLDDALESAYNAAGIEVSE